MHIENLDHLGLVAGIIDELGLVELTDEIIGRHKLQQISTGQVVKAMILNCLGFVSAPLYLFSEFFESKPTEHLLGAGVKPKHLNDDRLGRSLDDLHKFGVTNFFLKAAMQAAERFEVKTERNHLDSTSISVSGEYLTAEVLEDREEPVPISIKRGYSRDHRPDLKQFMIDMVCSADGGIPLWLRVGSGNESDAQQFAPILQEFSKQWQVDGLYVIDAAFYNEPSLQQVGSLRWLSRVPQTLSTAQALVQRDVTELTEVECNWPDYRMWETLQTYGGIEQRWLLIESQSRQQDIDLWQPQLEKVESSLNRQLKKLSQQIFACKPDAMEALLQFQSSLEWHQLIEVSIEKIYPKRAPGRPCYDQEKPMYKDIDCRVK
jgi:transposase